jgi:UDP-N-acetyl-D-mannosaminuronic acid transferase (WecB/TagA/CpsF family)
MKKNTKPKGPSAGLLGVGLDNTDGHKRITQGDKFAIVGGSSETHEKMTETVIKTFEELKNRGKHLEAVEPQELAEIIHKSSPK